MIMTDFIKLRKKAIEKYFSRMNDKQLEAVLHTEGPLLILAGAGSGKTTVLVSRIANLLMFGNAYHSENFYTPAPDQIERLQAYVNGGEYFDEMPFILAENPPKPWEILAITFTNKAAEELKTRLSNVLGPDAESIWASTFHSACTRILRRNCEALGYTSHFTIYDTDDSKRTIKECQRILGIDDKFLPVKFILSQISRAKDSLITPNEYQKQNQTDIRLMRVGQVYAKYQELLKSSDAMDFDDIIVNTVSLLENNDEIREYYQDKFKYILIDEYQDTNFAQYKLCSILADKHRNFCVVGDDDQSIYKFRGATIENILNFEHQYPNAKVIRLEQNYRSTQNILDAANAVIGNNEQRKGKNLWTGAGKGDKLDCFTAYDEHDESRYIADTIFSNVNKGSKYSDHAVLCRMNAQTNALETSFIRMGIPYRIIGGHRFYERKEIRDAIAYLTLISNHSDNLRLRRIINEPKRGIGDTTMATAADIADGLGLSIFEVISNAEDYPRLSRAQSKLKEFTQTIEYLTEKSEDLPLHEFFKLVMKETHYIEGLKLDEATYQDRLANIQELTNNLQNYENENEDATINGFLEEVALMTDIDNYNAESDSVVVMTIHSAKGLEFPKVFLPGMEEGIFPGIQSTYNPEEVEEERRLAYVALTRAKEKLYISHAKTRMIFGSTSHNMISRFVREIPTELLEIKGRNVTTTAAPYIKQNEHKTDYSASRSFTRPTVPKASSAKYNVGDTVVHKTFGTGMVISAKPMGNDTMLEIAFSKVGTKRLMANYANLTTK